MKNIIRIISLIFVVTAIGGCGKSQQYQESTDFPKGMKTELTEQIKVNAEFQYPENCKNGKCAETQISGQTLWDKQEEIAQLLVQDGNITNEYIDDYGTVQYKIYEIAENNATLVISDDNLNYATDQASYINNVLFSDSHFDDYNGNKYQDKTDLPFMPQKEAWKNVSEVLDKLGVDVSDDVICYVMEHSIMSEEEKKAIARAEEEDTKIPTAKTQWTEDDDCYYFMTYTTWQDYPVLPPVMGEGFDENNVSVIYDKNGIQSLSINGYYPLELKNEVEVVSPEMVLKALEKYFGNIISDDIYEVQRISLCQKVVQVNPDKHSAEIEPVWECRVLVKNSDSPDSSYLQKIYFHAETLKVM